ADKSHTPAVTEMLVILAGVRLANTTADPTGTVAVISSPMNPAPTAPPVANPGSCPAVAPLPDPDKPLSMSDPVPASHKQGSGASSRTDSTDPCIAVVHTDNLALPRQ